MAPPEGNIEMSICAQLLCGLSNNHFNHAILTDLFGMSRFGIATAQYSLSPCMILRFILSGLLGHRYLNSPFCILCRKLFACTGRTDSWYGP